ncbi:MAG: phage-shock protein [Desulfobacteraceae bacterium]|jgi:phage shock protein B
MEGPFIVMIVFGSIVLVLAIIASTILMGLKILKGGVSQKDQKNQSDEARIIQEIYQGLARMEERVESLETILLERERARKEQRK